MAYKDSFDDGAYLCCRMLFIFIYALGRKLVPLLAFASTRLIIQPSREALRALGLLLADGALTVGRGKTF